ncbi:MAG TPA: hypothetical protein DCQ79_05470 [Rhizobiales bacterium]|nr:hypothetical protein [Hyphomicrobiales bacterium]
MGVLCGPYLGVLVVGSEEDYRKQAEDCLRRAYQATDAAARLVWLSLSQLGLGSLATLRRTKGDVPSFVGLGGMSVAG